MARDEIEYLTFAAAFAFAFSCGPGREDVMKLGTADSYPSHVGSLPRPAGPAGAAAGQGDRRRLRPRRRLAQRVAASVTDVVRRQADARHRRRQRRRAQQIELRAYTAAATRRLRPSRPSRVGFAGPTARLAGVRGRLRRAAGDVRGAAVAARRRQAPAARSRLHRAGQLHRTGARSRPISTISRRALSRHARRRKAS